MAAQLTVAGVVVDLTDAQGWALLGHLDGKAAVLAAIEDAGMMGVEPDLTPLGASDLDGESFGERIRSVGGEYNHGEAWEAYCEAFRGGWDLACEKAKA